MSASAERFRSLSEGRNVMAGLSRLLRVPSDEVPDRVARMAARLDVVLVKTEEETALLQQVEERIRVLRGSGGARG